MIYRCGYHLSRNQYDVIINLVWVIFYIEERVSIWRNRKKKSVRRQGAKLALALSMKHGSVS